MDKITALQDSVDKIVADIALAVTDKAALKAQIDALNAQVTDLQAQLAAFADVGTAADAMKAKLDAADAALIA